MTYMYIDKKRKEHAITLTKLCKLSELGLCKKRFKQKVFWQEFCKPEHQESYWKIIKKEKRAIIRMLGDHEKRLINIEGRIKRLGGEHGK